MKSIIIGASVPSLVNENFWSNIFVNVKIIDKIIITNQNEAPVGVYEVYKGNS